MAKGLAALRARHKGRALAAHVNPDGTIRFNGRVFTSPSRAGAAAVNRRSCNGWTFWKYEATPNHWLNLDTFRKEPPRRKRHSEKDALLDKSPFKTYFRVMRAGFIGEARSITLSDNEEMRNEKNYRIDGYHWVLSFGRHL